MSLSPIYTNHLFRGLAGRLIRLLRSLPLEAWDAPTCYPEWKVHDIATHLLHSGIARLSSHRDEYGRLHRARFLHSMDFESLSERIDAINTQWCDTLYFVSPRVVVDLLKKTERDLAMYFYDLERVGLAPIGVGWAGEDVSSIWFDTAREFAERWHHQQQIRDAVGAYPITFRA